MGAALLLLTAPSGIAGTLPPFEGVNLCDGDDRQLSAEAAVARLRITDGPLSGTGTVFMTDLPAGGAEKCFLSAGHNFTQIPETAVVEFDVPASGEDCELALPPLEKRFDVDFGTLVRAFSQIGDDWAVFRVEQNAVTGRTAFQEQQGALALRLGPPPASGTVRVTGHGSDNGAGCFPCSMNGERHHVQQTDAGPVGVGQGFPHEIGFFADVCAGSSGSPVLLESTGEVVGIVVDGECVGSSTGQATALSNPDLLAAIAQCETEARFVFSDDFESGDLSAW